MANAAATLARTLNVLAEVDFIEHSPRWMKQAVQVLPPI
jgi:hypothetical protein